MTPIDLVVRFLADLALALRGLRAVTIEVARESPNSPLTARDAAGTRRRRGVIPGLGTFALHGVGCRVEFDAGEEVDFDWTPDGSPSFDTSRLTKYASSIDVQTPDESELLAACNTLIQRGILREVAEGWFAVQK